MDKLNRTTQCQTCPWRVGSTVAQIPNYDPKQHEHLICTIAEDDQDYTVRGLMACHYSEEGKPEPCIGYLHNQLGVGNNIPLRIRATKWSNAKELKVVGKQVQNFKDTFK